MIYMSDNGDGEPKNVLGEKLLVCSREPTTGYARDGFCREIEGDRGRHQICAKMTNEFLEYSKKQGNDLTTPRPQFDFPGLDPGDFWCVCVPRWLEAFEDDVAPPVKLEATSKAVLDDVPMNVLQEYAVSK